MSARANICRSPNISFRSKNTRSAREFFSQICLSVGRCGREKSLANLPVLIKICLSQICLHSDKNPYLTQTAAPANPAPEVTIQGRNSAPSLKLLTRSVLIALSLRDSRTLPDPPRPGLFHTQQWRRVGAALGRSKTIILVHASRAGSVDCTSCNNRNTQTVPALTHHQSRR